MKAIRSHLVFHLGSTSAVRARNRSNADQYGTGERPMKTTLPRFSALWMLACWIVAPLSFAEAPAATAPSSNVSAPTAEQEILAAIRARLDAAAHNDLKEWARYVADDALAPLEGTTRYKQAWMTRHASWPRDVKTYYGPLEDVKVRIHGDTAVVAYRAKQYVDVDGQVTYAETWQIETHMRRGKDWVQVAVADAPIPREPVAANVDPNAYDAYVGQYQWAPDLVSTITREGDKLFETFLAGDKTELAPETETTFFYRGGDPDSTRITFVKDATDRVTHYVYRTYGSTDFIAKKIK
jgi:ketosteroid isomerase-like protein